METQCLSLLYDYEMFKILFQSLVFIARERSNMQGKKTVTIGGFVIVLISFSTFRGFLLVLNISF